MQIHLVVLQILLAGCKPGKWFATMTAPDPGTNHHCWYLALWAQQVQQLHPLNQPQGESPPRCSNQTPVLTSVHSCSSGNQVSAGSTHPLSNILLLCLVVSASRE